MDDILNSFSKSLRRFEEILKKEKSVEVCDSAIQRFEFTVELAWKTMQKFLREEDIVCRSPKECIKESFKFGLVNDNPLWLKMFDDRNLTTHTYDEKLAGEIYERLPQYLEILQDLEKKLRAQ